MITIALKMLIGNRASCLGVIFGIFLATLLISQQSAIFLGLVSRSYRMITDTPAPNLWIIDPVTESDEKIRGIPSEFLNVVRSVPNIEWAVPLGAAYMPLETKQGVFDICKLYGVDDNTFIGVPPKMVKGKVEDLLSEGAIIIDEHSAKGLLAKVLPNGTKVPLDIGDELEINNHRAVVVGICRITQGFYPQSIIFTAFQEFLKFSSITTNPVAFILAKTKKEANINSIHAEVYSGTGLNTLTSDEFKSRIVESFLKTGILINFGLSVILGLIIGFSITGQIFYIMTIENLTYYALIKALGGTDRMILKMITTQVLIVGFIGFCLGTAATILWGIAIKDTTLAFLFPWQLFLFTFLIVLIICLFTATLSIRKVFKIEPKLLMGN